MRKLFSHHRRHVFFIISLNLWPIHEAWTWEKLSRRATTYTAACMHLQMLRDFLFSHFAQVLVECGEDRLMLVFAFHMLRRDSCWREKLIWIRVFLSFPLQLHHPPVRWWQTIEKIPLVKCFLLQRKEFKYKQSEANLTCKQCNEIYIWSCHDERRATSSEIETKKKLFLKKLEMMHEKLKIICFRRSFGWRELNCLCSGKFLEIDCKKKILKLKDYYIATGFEPGSFKLMVKFRI